MLTLLPAAYSFLDPKKEHGLLAAYIAGIGAAGIIIFALARSLCALRARLAPPRKPMPDGSSPIVERIKREGPGRWSWRQGAQQTAAAEELEEWEIVETRERPSAAGRVAA